MRTQEVMYFDYSFPNIFTSIIYIRKIGTDKLTPVQTNTANNYIIHRSGKIYLQNDQYQPDPQIFSFIKHFFFSNPKKCEKEIRILIKIQLSSQNDEKLKKKLIIFGLSLSRTLSTVF